MEFRSFVTVRSVSIYKFCRYLLIDGTVKCFSSIRPVMRTLLCLTSHLVTSGRLVLQQFLMYNTYFGNQWSVAKRLQSDHHDCWCVCLLCTVKQQWLHEGLILIPFRELNIFILVADHDSLPLRDLLEKKNNRSAKSISINLSIEYLEMIHHLFTFLMLVWPGLYHN